MLRSREELPVTIAAAFTTRRASKLHSSMRSLGAEDPDLAAKRFEKAFRTSADDAAEIILRGVAKNARRVLVGTDAHLIDLVQRLLPAHYHGVVTRLYGRVVGHVGKKEPATAESVAPASSERVVRDMA